MLKIESTDRDIIGRISIASRLQSEEALIIRGSRIRNLLNVPSRIRIAFSKALPGPMDEPVRRTHNLAPFLPKNYACRSDASSAQFGRLLDFPLMGLSSAGQ